MDHKVIWTIPATDDLQAIVSALAKVDVAAASRLGHRILDHTDLLAEFPALGPVYERRGSEVVRVIYAEPYHIFYRVLNEAAVVEIMHVRHTAQKPPRF